MDTLIELFQRSVRRHPDRPAVTDDDRTVSYARLDRESDLIADATRAAGVAVGDRVAVHLPRSVDLVTAMLGALKAGAAYVTIDTRYPDARREVMVRGSGARVAITDTGAVRSLRALLPTVLDSADLGHVAATDTERSPAGVGPDTAASVLFTSGSSGTPKAVVLEHRNLVSLATNTALPALTPSDRVGQVSNVSFDAFHIELWNTLAAGAHLVVLPPVPDMLADFAGHLDRHGITVMMVPTMVVNQVVREAPDAFAGLRILQTGGDVLSPAACRELLSGRFTGTLYNLYGPTEITTACTAHRVSAEDAATGDIPIGRPLAGTVLRVLTPDLTPVAPGEVGELVVGGAGVARGYLDAPELTAERFVANPFDPAEGRLYRTGDLVRQTEDGVLHFVGRQDGQVKIRGFRVEPGEVERALARHPGVHEATVLPDGTGEDRRLVAFVVLDHGTSTSAVRAHAEAELPHFMVPSELIEVPRLPTSEHGKRDLDALRERLAEHRESAEDYVSPTGETAEYLARLWQELLGVDRVGMTEDFFGLGGHSLQVFRVQRRIERDLGVRLEQETLMTNTTLRDLAGAVDERRGELVGRA